jgi:hypothetical protein
MGQEKEEPAGEGRGPPDSHEIDAAWESGDEPPSTEVFDPRELLESDEVKKTAPPASGPPAGEPEDRATMPPPVPHTEYVARMMGETAAAKKQPSLAERHRAILETLHEEDPLQFDFEEAAKSALKPPKGAKGTAPPPTRRAPGSAAGPSIEMSEESVDDMDPELLKDTPVPPKPPAEPMDELDDLPVDEVLMSVSGRQTTGQPKRFDQPKVPVLDLAEMDVDLNPQSDPRQRSVETAPPPISDDVPDELEMELEPEAGYEHVNDRLTIPGYDPNNKLDQIQDRFVTGDYSGAARCTSAASATAPRSPAWSWLRRRSPGSRSTTARASCSPASTGRARSTRSSTSAG